MQNMVESKPATCKRCGYSDCAWVKSKNGKWYLVEGGYCHPDLKGTGKLMYSIFQFHDCQKRRELNERNRKQDAAEGVGV